MDKVDILGLKVRQQLHDAFAVCVSREAHRVHLQINRHVATIDVDVLLASEDSIAERPWHAVTGNDNCVLGIRCPFLEGLKGQSAV